MSNFIRHHGSSQNGANGTFSSYMTQKTPPKSALINLTFLALFPSPFNNLATTLQQAPISTAFKTVSEILASCSWNFVSGLRSRITSYGKISTPTTNKFYNYSTTQLPFNGPEML